MNVEGKMVLIGATIGAVVCVPMLFWAMWASQSYDRGAVQVESAVAEVSQEGNRAAAETKVTNDTAQPVQPAPAFRLPPPSASQPTYSLPAPAEPQTMRTAPGAKQEPIMNQRPQPQPQPHPQPVPETPRPVVVRQSEPITVKQGAILAAKDGTYLGKFIGDKYDLESICNPYGTYGSKYSLTSIWNEYGNYGSPYSLVSAFNKYALDPPRIMKDGRFVAYLTANPNNNPAVSPFGICGVLR